MKILHVTEASAGGVLESIVELANAQARQKHQVKVVLYWRSDTPSPVQLAARFSSSVEWKLLQPGSLLKTLTGMARCTRAHLSEGYVVHLHSSWAGFAGRTAVAFRKVRNRVVYSPHGWSFLRRDFSIPARALFLLMENLFSFLCVVVCVSQSERKALAVSRLNRGVITIANGVTLPTSERITPKRRVGNLNRPLTIASGGRLVAQKDPGAFSQLALELGERFEFIWLGGLHASKSPSVLNTRVVKHYSEMDHAQFLRKLAEADMFVSCALWEGMPLMLLEAQALGIPVIATNCVGNRDVVVDGETGFLCRSKDEMKNRIVLLASDQEMRRRMSLAAKERSESFKISNQVTALESLYEKLLRVSK